MVCTFQPLLAKTDCKVSIRVRPISVCRFRKCFDHRRNQSATHRSTFCPSRLQNLLTTSALRDPANQHFEINLTKNVLADPLCCCFAAAGQLAATALESSHAARTNHKTNLSDGRIFYCTSNCVSLAIVHEYECISWSRNYAVPASGVRAGA